MVDPGIALCLGVRAEVYLPGYLIFLALVSYSKTIPTFTLPWFFI